MVGVAQEVLALIPARGGSKSILRKNIKRFGEHPLIAYSIAAGLQARCVNRVIVSTDDPEIADVARAYGAEVPFMRPAALAEDHVLDYPVFEHALEWLDAHEGYRPGVIVQLRPTSPLRGPGWIDEGVALLARDAEADSVRAVVVSGENPYKMWRKGDRYLEPLLSGEFEEPYNMPRQKLPPTFWQTGHLDVMRRRTIISKHSLTGDHVLALTIAPGYAVDIDTHEDWELGEWVLAHRRLDLVRPASSDAFWRGVRLLVLDFDGVLTDNRVHVLEDGREAVVCHRGDGMGIGLLKKSGIGVMVISKERNPVVMMRCEKLKVPCHQAIDDKAPLLHKLVNEAGLDLSQVVYVGNDVNDLACMALAGRSVAVADAHPDVLAQADWVVSKPGGHGAVREVCDRILAAT